MTQGLVHGVQALAGVLVTSAAADVLARVAEASLPAHGTVDDAAGESRTEPTSRNCLQLRGAPSDLHPGLGRVACGTCRGVDQVGRSPGGPSFARTSRSPESSRSKLPR